MPGLDGEHTPEKQKGRRVLTPRDPHVEALHKGLDLDAQALAEVRVFGKFLWSERNRWDVQRRSLPTDAEGWLRGGGFAQRLTKDDADKRLRLALAALDGGAR